MQQLELEPDRTGQISGRNFVKGSAWDRISNANRTGGGSNWQLIGKCKRHNVEKLKKDKRDDTCKGKVENLIGITIRLFSLYFLFE